jgi:hypothetical protein
MRYRTVMTCVSPVAPLDDEALAHALFDTLSEHAAAGSPQGTRLSISTLIERVMRVAGGGRA